MTAPTDRPTKAECFAKAAPHLATLVHARRAQQADVHPMDQGDTQPRERAVPCRVIGCPGTTWNIQRLCGRHLESDETVTPRHLEAVDALPPGDDEREDTPAGHHPPPAGALSNTA